MIDFHAAVQDPRNTFTDPELKAGKVAETPLGLPLALGGTFALTYTVQTGRKKLAVRCFHRNVPNAQNRYAKISTKLRLLSSPYFVNFEFQPQGIRVLRAQYPIVKMEWAEGDTLGMYLDRVVLNSGALSALRRSFATLAEYLERNEVAHGDIQNENVIVANGMPRLIDYDGMFVSGLTEGDGAEVGHKHFQHPQREVKHFGPKMDNFSFLVIDTSLEALEADPSLYRRFREGGQAIIFKANDFADPSSSEVFRILDGMPVLRETAKKLAAVCSSPIASVPTLADFRADRNIPISVASTVSAPPKNTQSATYIGAFDVIDAADFDSVLRRVGDRVELVGKIVSVKIGTGRRGRGRDLPYIFVNFGPWNKQSVKITIWSEGLGNLKTAPTVAWASSWISVTGLIEPPYKGQHYGRPYTNVGITVVSDSQILRISPDEAQFRLGRGAKRQTPQSDDEPKSKNLDILDIIKRRESWAGPSTPTTTASTQSKGTGGIKTAPTPPPTPKTKNQQILQTLQPPSGSQVQGTPQRYSPPPPVSTPSLLSRVPTWIWIVGGIALLIFLARGN
jgi:hypothetical protein